VVGTTNNSAIAGAFIARGPEIKPVVEVAPDWESYKYKRIDLENAEHKAFFEAALAWDLEVGDKKWVDGKNVRRSPFTSRVMSLISIDSSSKCIWLLYTLAPLTSPAFGLPKWSSLHLVSLSFCSSFPLPLALVCFHYLCMCHQSCRCIV